MLKTENKIGFVSPGVQNTTPQQGEEVLTAIFPTVTFDPSPVVIVAVLICDIVRYRESKVKECSNKTQRWC